MLDDTVFDAMSTMMIDVNTTTWFARFCSFSVTRVEEFQTWLLIWSKNHQD